MYIFTWFPPWDWNKKQINKKINKKQKWLCCHATGKKIVAICAPRMKADFPLNFNPLSAEAGIFMEN